MFGASLDLPMASPRTTPPPLPTGARAETLDATRIAGEDPRQPPADVVVLGGSFSGTSTALLLKRWLPWARIVVVESKAVFDGKVGEATVELSGLFLLRALGLWDLLSREHLPKHGLRFWTTDHERRSLAEMTELGPGSQPDVPSFQLDRAALDEALLERAQAAGVELLRPARVVDVRVAQTLGQESQVAVEVDGSERLLRTRWVVDATGRHGFLPKRLKLREKLAAHPTTAYWGRWRGAGDLDGERFVDPSGRDAGRLPPVACSRRLATNHFLGRGWWTWVIPLKDGQTSIGLVHDERHFDLPGSGSLRPRYEAFVREAAGLRELVEDAELDQDDFRTYRHLPYRASRYMGPGWALVGDSAAFLDPFYSPGLDHCSFSVYATARLIQEALSHESTGAQLESAIERHNAAFARSFDRLFDALYRDKYEIFGDPELLTTAYHLDTGLYYLGVVGPAHRDLEELRWPVLGRSHRRAEFAYRTLRFFHRRVVHHARVRQERGLYGRRAAGWRNTEFRFGLGASGARPLIWGLGRLLGLEASSLWARLRRPAPIHTVADAPRTEAAPTGETRTA